MLPLVRNIISAPYTLEAKRYFAALTIQPSPQRKAAIDKFIRGMIGAGLWHKFDLLYLMASHDNQAARVNLVNPGTYTLAVNGTPTFTVNRGYKPVATDGTDYLDTGFAINAGKLAQDSAHVGVWSLTDNQGNAHRSYDVGTNNTLTVTIGRSDNGSGTIYFRPCNTTSVDSSGGAYYPGHAMWSRTASNAFQAYSQGVATADSGSTASAAIGTANLHILRTGPTNGEGNNEIAIMHSGSSFVAANAAAMFNFCQIFLRSVVSAAV